MSSAPKHFPQSQPQPQRPPHKPQPPSNNNNTTMSGKRLAKRSIVGTRVVAPGDDGKYYPGYTAAVKTCEGADSSEDPPPATSRYSVRFEHTRAVGEFHESEIIGPGFSALTGSKLRAGQIVYVTHANREVQGSVIHHRPNLDQVIIRILVSSMHDR